jgi:hypothetical protein
LDRSRCKKEIGFWKVRGGQAPAPDGPSGAGCSLNTDRTAVLFVLELFVFFSETLDTAGRVDQLLLAGEKRMALGANFDADVLFGGSDLDGVAAGTLDGRGLIIRMDVCFHFYFNPL